LNNRSLLSIISSFCFGVTFGVFFTIIVIREAFPLREHYIALSVCSVLAVIITLVLIVWYFRVLSASRRAFGEKGGGIINTILSFLLVSIILIFILIVGIFYAAIA